MLRFAVAIILTGCLVSTLRAGARAEGIIVVVSKTGFVLQTDKGLKTFKASEFQLTGAPSPYGETWDLIFRLKHADLREGMEVKVDYRTEKGEWICQGVRPKAAEIDFDPLEKADRKFTVQLTLTAADGTKLEMTYGFETGTPVQLVRDRFLKSLQPLPRSKNRWAVFAWGENYLAIDGYLRDDKFKVIEKVEVKCPELPPEAQPLVHQRGKPWPTRDMK
jgi:hypothetical protein